MRIRSVTLASWLLWAACGIMTTATVAAEPATVVVIRPESAPGPLDNPLKGWCPPSDARSIRQPYSMVYLDASWKDLEPTEGQYAFDAWEKKGWSAPLARGKHIVFRPYIDYPSRPSGMPDWLRDEGVKMTPYRDHGGGLSPDYDAPRMVAAMERLIEAMGRRYDADPRVAFVELGLLGFWGEWHTYPLEKLYAQPETEKRLIAAYRRAFPHKILLARSARDEAGRQPWLGFHDDMFPEDTDNGQDWSFLATIRESNRAENWHRAAIGGEMVPGQARKWLGSGHEQTEAMIRKGHFSWIGPSCPALTNETAPEFRSRSEALVQLMGYQYRLIEIQHPPAVAPGQPFAVEIQGENEGVAPFYYPWPVDLGLLDENGRVVQKITLKADPRDWRPGAFRIADQVRVEAPEGRYHLALGIRDPWTNRPAVQFANKLERREGWTLLGTLQVEPVKGN